nr:hypothetical protein [Tanacetum cinerariifolium]
MATTDKESSAAGTDNRPPMFVESDYESWKIRIERYIRGKPLGKLIWRSIQNGPTPHPQITVTEGQCAVAVQLTRDKTNKEFTEIENNRELADIQATNILSQGLPRHPRWDYDPEKLLCCFRFIGNLEEATSVRKTIALLRQAIRSSPGENIKTTRPESIRCDSVIGCVVT